MRAITQRAAGRNRLSFQPIARDPEARWDDELERLLVGTRWLDHYGRLWTVASTLFGVLRVEAHDGTDYWPLDSWLEQTGLRYCGRI